MPNWRITAFDRTLARGICTSGIGALPFNASVALVDDFVLGEEVDVSLRRLPDGSAASYEVTRIVPTGWRSPFTAPSVSAPGTAIEHFLPDVTGRRAWLTTTDDDVVRIQVEDDSYRPQRALVFAGAIFVQCPTEIDTIATIHAFAPADVLQLAPELGRHWPAIPANCTVFRIDPQRFGDAAAYVIARSIGLAPI